MGWRKGLRATGVIIQSAEGPFGVKSCEEERKEA